LNFGHTFGHAVENLTGYKRYRHGEAVALGMAAASRMACQLGILSAGDEAEIIALVARAGLPVGGTGLNPTELYSALAYDKKVIAGEINFVLPLSIGKAEVFSGIKQEDVLQAIRTIC
ncbi:MAG: 3-dehydroquinate synthase, partial [Peptococcaceae bacterium]|nr:3-dehydroquinate synthase [Peptococcaceae bacterium]